MFHETMQILYVEDNDGDVLLTREAFEDADLNVILSVVRNGREALEYLNKRLPDLILLDINLPAYNGHEVLSQIRAESKWAHIPVFLMSSSSHYMDRKKAVLNKADAYLQKPLEIDIFLAELVKLNESESPLPKMV